MTTTEKCGPNDLCTCEPSCAPPPPPGVVTEEKAWAAWNKIQEDGPDLDFESFWEILKEVFAPSANKE